MRRAVSFLAGLAATVSPTACARPSPPTPHPLTASTTACAGEAVLVVHNRTRETVEVFQWYLGATPLGFAKPGRTEFTLSDRRGKVFSAGLLGGAMISATWARDPFQRVTFERICRTP
jgi:hypothetical protein